MACATLFVHGRIDTRSAAESGVIDPPDAARVQALALGFEPVIADYYWIQALQVVGALDHSSSNNETVGNLIELVTTLDPWVDHPYRFAALWLNGSREEVEWGNAILAKGISYHPLDWRNRFYLGYNLFFFLEDDKKAAEVLESALAFEAAPDYLGAFVGRLRASGDSLETAAVFLEQLIRETQDEYAKLEYLKAFDEIETERRARDLDRARSLFVERHGRDIRRPAELWEGALAVIARRPKAHPEQGDARWELDEEGEIVSSHYGRRYRVYVHPEDELRRQRWRQETDERQSAAAGERSA